jgi:hypothetical protein
MKKMLGLIVVVIAILAAMPAIAGTSYTIGAGSQAAVASGSGTFNNGFSLTQATAGNQSAAGVTGSGKDVSSYAVSTGGTATLSLHGFTMATQSGAASAYIIKTGK